MTDPTATFTTATCTAALRVLVNNKAAWFTAAPTGQVDDLLQTLRDEAVDAISEALDDGRRNPCLAAAISTSAVARIVLAGSRKIRALEEGRA